MRKAVAIAVIAGTLIPGGPFAGARADQDRHHPAPTHRPALELSPGLASLLSQEMLAIEGGIGPLMTAMAAGDWPRVAETAERIEKTYILAQRLTPEQLDELGRVLPRRFKDLDAAFHGSAGKLARAARGREAELVVFYSYKMMEACLECHSAFAGERFPGFGNQGGTRDEAHEHP